MTDRRTFGDLAAGLPRNYVRSCILLLISEEASHGYDLLGRLESLGVAGADAGGLYRTLRSMEQEELLRSHWEVSKAGPARRKYEITDEGMDWLRAWASAHRETTRVIGLFLHRFESVVPTSTVAATPKS
jgi:poly-beta-hydroxybutyrate-responsive repressor